VLSAPGAVFVAPACTASPSGIDAFTAIQMDIRRCQTTGRRTMKPLAEPTIPVAEWPTHPRRARRHLPFTPTRPK
jgi:hypothetical protein